MVYAFKSLYGGKKSGELKVIKIITMGIKNVTISHTVIHQKKFHTKYVSKSDEILIRKRKFDLMKMIINCTSLLT